MKKALIFAIAAFATSTIAHSQATYTWNRTTTGTWNTSTNWTPARSTPANTDILVFNNGSVDTATGLTSQTIGQLLVTAGTSILIQSGNNRTLTIGGGTGTDLVVDAGSTLILGGTNGLTIAMGTGETGSIAGAVVFTGAGHRLNPSDVGALTFASGSTFTQTTGFTGNAFGTSGNSNAVVFASGSTFSSQAGSNPFGLTQPASRIQFQQGSLYVHAQNTAPDFNGRTYANFQLNRAGASLTATGTNPLSIDTLTLTAGNLSIGVTASFSLKGSVNVASGSTLTFNPSAAATLTLNGGSLQDISGSGAIVFQTNQNLAVNGAGVVIDRNISLPGSLTITAGNVTLGSGNLVVAGVISGAGAGHAIVASGAGLLKRYIPAASQFQFPVSANGADYCPLTIALGTGDLADTFSVGIQQGVIPAASNNAAAVQKTWTISQKSGTDSNATLTFQWSATDEGSSFSRSAAGIWRYNGSIWLEPSAGMTLGSGPFTLSSILPLKAYGTYIVGNDGVLPITLASFRGVSVRGKGVCLSWSTISEINNYGFEVERSVNMNGPYQTVSPLIQGHGTTNVPQSYTFTDESPVSGTAYYRLKQIDLDLTVEFFEPVAVSTADVQGSESAQTFRLHQNYPNPFNPETEIQFAVDRTGPATVVVYNSIGQVVKTLYDGVAQTGQSYIVRFNGANFASGVYFCRLESMGKSDLRKMILMR